MKLYGVRVFARDWDAVCDFYRDTLGLPERYRNADALTGRMLGVSLQVDDILATYEALRKRGVDFLEPPKRQPWGGCLAHFRDPEGNVLTLLG
jgi:lactoylglutathione lyase